MNIKIKKIIVFIIGLFIVTLGARFYILADFGALSYDSFCMSIAGKIGISTGLCINIFGVVIIFLVALLTKSKPDFKVMLSSLVFGTFFDFWGVFFNNIGADLSLNHRIIVFAAGLIICPFGIAVYLLPELSPSSLDHLMMGIKDAFSISIRNSRNIIEAFFFVAAFLLKGPVGIATFIIVLAQGTILQFFYNRLKPKYNQMIPVN